MRVHSEERGRRHNRHLQCRPRPHRHHAATSAAAAAATSISWPVYAVVAVVAVACYVNGLDGEFVHDDIPAVVHNKDVLAVTPLADVFCNDFWGTPMGDVHSHKSYRPLTTLTFRINYQLSGLSPTWFHTCNVFLHAVASVLFTRVCLAVAGLQLSFAGLAGLLFAVHPVHTEAVTGIVGRADVLASVFFLLSFLAYHGHRDGPGHMSVWVSVVLGGVSMLAKETGVAAMIVNLAYDFYRSWPNIKKSLSEVRWNNETLHFSRRTSKVLMSLSVLLVFRLALLQGSLPKFSNQDNPASFHPSRHVRLLTFCYLCALNCWLLVCPATLSHDWQMGSVPLVTTLADSRNIATCVFLVCCVAVAYKTIAEFEHQRHPPLVLGALLAALPFLPASNLMVTVGFVVAERVLYIPSLGFLLLVAYGAQLAWRVCTRRRSLLLAAAVALVLVFGARTVARNRDWASREVLIRAGLKALPHNAKMHYNLANFLRDSSLMDQATRHYKEALRLWPTYASAHNNLGTLMSGTDEAESHFLAAIKFSPDHVNAHYNLGQVYRKENRTTEAIRLLERCITLDSSYTPAFLLLARLHADRAAVGHQHSDRAAVGLQHSDRVQVGRLLRHVTRLQPISADNMAEYAAWLAKQGRAWEALSYYMKALHISATHRPSLLEAAKILRSKGQWPRIHQIMTRSHLAVRESLGAVVFKGDLYIHSWKLETESLYRKYELKTNSQIHEQENTKSYIEIKSERFEDNTSSTKSSLSSTSSSSTSTTTSSTPSTSKSPSMPPPSFTSKPKSESEISSFLTLSPEEAKDKSASMLSPSLSPTISSRETYSQADATNDGENECKPQIKMERSWRRLAVNRSAADKSGTNTDMSCSLLSESSGYPLSDQGGSSSEKAAFNQVYEYIDSTLESSGLLSEATVADDVR